MGRTVGIDLGTSFSAVAVMGAAGSPEILRNREGESITPSVVLFENASGVDQPVVGAHAKHQAAVRPDDTVQYVKRFLGDKSWRFDSAAGGQFRSEEVSAIILKSLVQAAEEALGEPITDAVITVPAYFDDSRRTATKQAGEIAGLNVRRVLNEPTAAALAYGFQSDADGTLLVYDLGGGTFDVTVLRIESNTFDVLSTDGDRNLGGFDWDNAIMDLIVSKAEAQYGVADLYDDLKLVAELRERAESAKHALSSLPGTKVQFSNGGTHFSIDISRDEFEAKTKRLLRRTEETVEDTMTAAGVTWDDIDFVLLVGGSTRMPMVRELMERVSGRPAELGVDPDESVALGAAIQASIEDHLAAGESVGVAAIQVADVTSHALGTTALDENGDVKNYVVIEKNEKVPATGSQVLSTAADRTEIYVTVLQGEDPDPDFAIEIGEGVVQLTEALPKGTDFEVIYWYDIDQTVTVELRLYPSGDPLGVFDIGRIANMTSEHVEASTQKVSGLTVGGVVAKPVTSEPLFAARPTGQSIQPQTTRITTQSTSPMTQQEA